MTPTTIAILGGDLRQCYLAEYMDTHGYEVACFGIPDLPGTGRHFIDLAQTLPEALESAQLVVGPIPFSRDGEFLYTPDAHQPSIPIPQLLEQLKPGQQLLGGSIPESVRQGCSQRQVPVWDLLQDEKIALTNAQLTAEGFLSILLGNTPFSLKGKRLLLLGYGKCGQTLGRLLRYLDIQITALDQSSTALTAARMDGITAFTPDVFRSLEGNFDVVVNTIPSQILTSSELRALPSHCRFFDLASAPWGVSLELAARLNLNCIRCPGIPGSMKPQSAGYALGRLIIERITSHGI